MRNQYNPKFKDFEMLVLNLVKNNKDDYQEFTFAYEVIEMFDEYGELYQQLTPYFNIRR